MSNLAEQWDDDDESVIPEAEESRPSGLDKARDRWGSAGVYDGEGDGDSDGLNASQLRSVEAADNDGTPDSGELPREKSRMAEESFYAGQALGTALAVAPAGRLAKAMIVMRSRKGQAGGVAGLLITLTIMLFAASAGSLDTEHYKNGFLNKGNASANRVLQKRRFKNILYALRKLENRLNVKAAKARLQQVGVDVAEDASGKMKSISTTSEAGTVDIDLEKDVGQQVDDLAADSAEMADDLINKVEPVQTLLGETQRGPAAEGFFKRWKISRLTNYLERAPKNPSQSEAETLKDNVQHADDDLRASEKPTLAEGSTGEFTDPNEVTDKDGVKSTSTVDAATSAEDFRNSLDDLTNGDISSLANGDAIPQSIDEGGAAKLTDALENVKPAEIITAVPEIAPAAGESLVKAEAKVAANPTGGVALVVAQESCRTMSAIRKVNNLRRSAYALELMRFGWKFMAFADNRKAGYSSAKANALMELWMHRQNSVTGQSFGTGGAIANMNGDKTVHASQSALSKYAIGFAAAGILATIANYIKPFAKSCSVVNNTFLNIGLAVVGIGEVILSGGTSLAANIASGVAAALPLLAIVTLYEVVMKISVPIMVRTGIHLALSGVEPGDMLEAATTSGVVAGMNGINASHAMAPSSQSLHTILMNDAAEFNKREVARMGVFDRYFNMENEESLIGRAAINLQTAFLHVKDLGVSQFVAKTSTSTTRKLARSIYPASYAQEATDSLCDDPQVAKYGLASDDFCNIYNDRAPDLDPLESERMLEEQGHIDTNGVPISDEMKEFIAQCTSGTPGVGPLYKNEVDEGGGENSETDLCVSSGAPMAGETKTIAEAYDLKGVSTPKISWWQKAIGNSAFAAPAISQSSLHVGLNDRILSYLGYSDDISDVQQTITGDFDNNEEGDTIADATTAPSPLPDTLDTGPDTSAIPCSAGEDGGPQDGYRDGALTKIRVCNVQKFYVNSQVSKQVNDMFTAASNEGFNFFVSGATGGFRTLDGQIAIYNNHCNGKGSKGPFPMGPNQATKCPGAAAPGYSNHQMGFALDLGCNKTNLLIPKLYTEALKNPCFVWLQANAGKYGFFEYGLGKASSRANLKGYEGWHWSVDGN